MNLGFLTACAALWDGTPRCTRMFNTGEIDPQRPQDPRTGIAGRAAGLAGSPTRTRRCNSMQVNLLTLSRNIPPDAWARTTCCQCR